MFEVRFSQWIRHLYALSRPDGYLCGLLLLAWGDRCLSTVKEIDKIALWMSRQRRESRSLKTNAFMGKVGS